jgi:hypothetical protein
MDGIELSALDTRAGANAGFWLKLRDPVKGKPLPARLKLLGMDSDRYRAKSHELQRRRQEELAQDPKARLTPDEIEARSMEIVAACTVGWEGLKHKGEALAFKDEASALELYRGWPWIFDQAQLAVLDRANFLPGSESA